MKISDILKNRMSFSFEVFPAKTDQPLEPLLKTLDKFYSFKPDFVSCTYGAGGTNIGRSAEVCGAIMQKGVECLSHFTCVGNRKQDVEEHLERYMKLGVGNVLALRGDIPEGTDMTQGDFRFANEMVSYIRRIYPELCIGAACYPEKHVECRTQAEDIVHLKVKQDCGADFFMSQLCYDIWAYERFLDKIRRAGITIPVIVGVLPVLNKNGIIRMALSNGCSIPGDLASIIGKYGEKPEEFKKAGKEYTVELIYKYMNAGIDGLHMYTLNKYDDVADILVQSGIRSHIVGSAGA